MKILVLGADGYLGWSLVQRLLREGNEVFGVDSGDRRYWVAEVGGASAIPIGSMLDRHRELEKNALPGSYEFKHGNILNYDYLDWCIKSFQPETIVHLAEMPSAPYSMIDRNHCLQTMQNNMIGTLNILFSMKKSCPDAHLIKLGTMGEYGTPDIDIPEGFIQNQPCLWTTDNLEADNSGIVLRKKCPMAGLPFPRQAPSWYHWTKVHDSNNIMFACKIWGLRATDIMQGVVYGTRIGGPLGKKYMPTRFDFDGVFGTAINRFMVQAVINNPITLYGAGTQKRGFIHLSDSIGCMMLIANNSPKQGEYKVINQFEEVYRLRDVAIIVKEEANLLKISNPEIAYIENPREVVEKMDHYYQPEHSTLLELGFKPRDTFRNNVSLSLLDLYVHRDQIKENAAAILPKINFRS